MKKRLTLAIPVVVLVILVMALPFGKIYAIRDDSGGTLLWNSNEAYLFIDVHRRGFRISYLEYPWMLLKELLYGVRGPDDQRTSVTVVHITASGVEHHRVEMLNEQPGNTPALYKAVEDLIYANCMGDVCKWTGDQFEKATEEERRRYDGTNQVTADEVEKGPGGWSQRRFGESVSDYEFTADIGGKFTLQVTNKVKNPGGAALLSVGLARPGQPDENIWHVDGRPRTVSRAEYRRAFERSPQW